MKFRNMALAINARGEMVVMLQAVALQSAYSQRTSASVTKPMTFASSLNDVLPPSIYNGD